VVADKAPVQKYWHELLKKVESGEFYLDPQNEFSELYVAFSKKEHDTMKTFVQTRFSGPPEKGRTAIEQFQIRGTEDGCCSMNLALVGQWD
jgi:hypothetical protein